MWNDLKLRPIELEQFIKETENGERGRTSPWRNTHSLCFTFWESTGIQVKLRSKNLSTVEWDFSPLKITIMVFCLKNMAHLTKF